MMDQCPKSIAFARALKEEFPDKIGEITQTTMQNFNTSRKYNIIVLRWTLGYMFNKEAAKVLRKLGKMLVENQS